MKFILIMASISLLSSCALMTDMKRLTETAPEVDYRDPYHREFDALLVDENSAPISEEFENAEYFSNFKKELCSKISIDDCKEKFYKTAIARMKSKYNQAPSDMLNNHCEAYPIECKQLAYVERAYSMIHNESVELKRNRHEARVEREEAERSQAIMRSIGSSMKSTTTNCTPTGFGGMRCTSY